MAAQIADEHAERARAVLAVVSLAAPRRAEAPPWARLRHVRTALEARDRRRGRPRLAVRALPRETMCPRAVRRAPGVTRREGRAAPPADERPRPLFRGGEIARETRPRAATARQAARADRPRRRRPIATQTPAAIARAPAGDARPQVCAAILTTTRAIAREATASESHRERLPAARTHARREARAHSLGAAPHRPQRVGLRDVHAPAVACWWWGCCCVSTRSRSPRPSALLGLPYLN